jgi:hypothetical protein
MRRLLLCLALVLSAAPAAACINDGELPSHEREFRSQYNNGPVVMVPKARSGWAVGGYSALLGGGAMLAVGATVLAVRGARRGA